MATEIIPIKTVHSLERCVLILRFDKKISEKEREQVFLTLQDFFSIQNSMFQKKGITGGAELSITLPERQKPTWQVFCFKNQFGVLTTDYSRWLKFFQEVKHVWEHILPLIPKKSIIGIFLGVLDVFEVKPPSNETKHFNFPVDTLIDPDSLFVAKSFISSPRTPAASSCIMTEPSKIPEWEAKTNEIHIVANVKDGGLQFLFDHKQSLHTGKTPLSTKSDTVLSVLSEAANLLHSTNKVVLSSLLTKEVQKKIGLNGE